MIIIDNNPLSYDNNVENGIPILSWYEDTNDKELLKLIPILKYMSNNDVIDVRYPYYIGKAAVLIDILKMFEPIDFI